MWLEILILAIVQGVAEFLPISSSGHIVVGAALFDRFGHPLEEKLTVNIVLHIGTLAAILVFYWQRICHLLGRDRRVIGLLVVASLPAAAVGLLLKRPLEDALRDPLLAKFMFLLTGAMFLVTGAMLLWSAGRQTGQKTGQKTGQTTCRELGYGRALLVGVFQAFALLPGISRSGATIVAGLGAGLRRDEAATFSFLLAIPAIGGAGLLEAVKLAREGPGSAGPGPLALGALLSFAVGLASLWWLVRWLKQGRLHLFAWWVIPLGLAVIAWQLFGQTATIAP